MAKYKFRFATEVQAAKVCILGEQGGFSMKSIANKVGLTPGQVVGILSTNRIKLRNYRDMKTMASGVRANQLVRFIGEEAPSGVPTSTVIEARGVDVQKADAEGNAEVDIPPELAGRDFTYVRETFITNDGGPDVK